MIIDKLEKLGLNRKEAQIYLAALELGETNIERLSQKAGIKRTTVYDVLKTLKDKGLIGITFKNNKKYYFANDPRKINEKLDEQKAIFRKLMPELLSFTNLIDNKPRIKLFEGEEGLKEIYLNTLRYPNEPIWTWTSEGIFSVLDNDFLTEYIQKRKDSKIPIYVIAPDNEIFKKYKNEDKNQLRVTRLINNKKYSMEVEINLYAGYKIGIISFKEKIGLLIESKKLHDAFKSIFDFNWDNCDEAMRQD